MCGILGVVNEDFSEEELQRALAVLRHRGPDGQGTYVDAALRVGLAHSRLSVIDPVGGAQPLFDQTGDTVLVCNGEIYDFERLRGELQRRGHRFSSQSDSEVILYLYREYGLDFVDHLRGEFALLLLDRPARRLIAVRDRFGIKPLYYSRRAGGVVFASEAKAIFATGLRTARLDPVKLRDNLCYVPVATPFADVESLPAGHVAIVEPSGGFELRKYWDLELGEGNPAMSWDDSLQLVRRQVDEAIGLRLRADVPVGIYLSGGIDSAVVAASAASLGGSPLRAFTIEMADDPQFNELPAARRMASHLGAELHSVRCTAQLLCGNLEACLWHAEQPVGNLHGVGKYMLSELARDQVKVVLTGEGADEVFLGYDYFRGEGYGIASQLTRGKEYYGQPASPVAERLRARFGFVPAVEMTETLAPRQRAFFHALFHPCHRSLLEQTTPLDRIAQYVDGKATSDMPLALQRQHYAIKAPLENYILTYLGDRAEMAHSIEGRPPLLDHRLFEAARAIPLEHKLHGGIEKHLLREAMKDRLPGEIYRARKQAYSAPQVPLTNPALKPLLEHYLSSKLIQQAGLFDDGAIRDLQKLYVVSSLSSRWRQGLNSLLSYVLSVQILHAQFALSLTPFHCR